MKTMSMENSGKIGAETAPQSSPLHLKEEILIDADPAQVWAVLTDLGNYASWNPFIVQSEGSIEKGRKIRNVMLLDGKKMTFKPTLLEVIPLKSFTWLGRTFLPGIIDGRHSFDLEEAGAGKTRLIQREQFSGILANWMVKKYGTKTAENFRRMNAALKARVEELNRK